MAEQKLKRYTFRRTQVTRCEYDVFAHSEKEARRIIDERVQGSPEDCDGIVYCDDRIALMGVEDADD